MSTDLGTAYIAIATSTRGVEKDIRNSLDAAGGMVANSSRSWGANITSSLGGAFNAVAKTASAAFAAVGVAIAANLGAAIDRVDTLNNFPKIMRNLGYSAKEASKSIAKISEKLTGLPTSLDAMAGTVQKLAPLTGGLAKATDLSLALNNALLAGGKSTMIQANAMEQYSQMLSLGKVDMMAWRSMVSAMPGQMDQLAKSLLGPGKNSMALYAAMKSGKVSFDDFNNAILKLNSDGLKGFASFEQQAKDATQGIGTAMANVTTAIRRSIANIIQAIGAEGVAKAINSMGSTISSAGKSVVGFIESLKPGGKNAEAFASALGGLAPILGIAAGAMAGLLSGLPLIGGYFSALTGPVGLIVGAIVGMIQNSEALRVAISAAASAVRTAVEPLAGVFVDLSHGIGVALGGAGDTLARFIQATVDTLSSLSASIDLSALVAVGGQIVSTLSPLGLVLKSLAPILPQLTTLFVQLADQGISTLVPLLAQLAPLAAQVGAVLVAAGTQIASALLPVLMDLASAVFPVLMQVISAAAPIVTQLVSALLPIVPIVANLISSLLPPLAAAIQALLPALVPVIDAALAIVQALIPFVSIAVELLGTVLPPLTAAIAALLPPLVSVVSWLAGQVAEALTRFAGLITSAVEPVRGFAKVVGEKMAAVFTWFAELPGKLTGPLSDLPGRLFTIGRDMIQGLINGVKDMLGSAVNAVVNVAQSMISAAMGALDEHSPSKVFKKIGQNVTRGLALGVSMESGIATRAITDLTNLITRTAEKASGKKAKKAAKKQAAAAVKLIDASQLTTLSLWALGEDQATDKLLAALTTKGAWAKSASAAIKKSTLADVQAAREVVASRLDAARSVLDQMKDAMASLRDQVASSITGEIDLVSAMGGTGWVKNTDAAGNSWYTSGSSGGMAGIRAHVSGLLAKARTFAGKIKDLIKAGFPSSIVQYIAGLGVVDGTTAASMILAASKADQSGLIGDWTALETVSTSVGSLISEQMYGAGISAQEGLIAGLLSDEAKLTAAAQSLADKLTAAVKKALKIKSPSRVFRDEVGLMVAKGAKQGLDAGRAMVVASARALLDPSMVRRPQWEQYSPGVSGVPDGEGRVVVKVTNNYPQPEPTSITVNKALQYAAALGV